MTALPRLKKLTFLHIVPYDRGAELAGFEEALRLIEHADGLGIDGARIRTRHLEYGVSSPTAFLATAAARTERIELGTAVIPVVYESPLRLAEDLATLDVLSGGRLQPGISAAVFRKSPEAAERIFGAHWEERLAKPYEAIETLLDFIRGVALQEGGEIVGLSPVPEYTSERVEPHSPGLAERIWLGSTSPESTDWAAAHGLGLLTANLIRWERTEDFQEAKRQQIERFRAGHIRGEAARVSRGYVLVPTDGATAEQRERYRAYVEARNPRTLGRHPQTGMLIEKDLYGSTEQIVDYLLADPSAQLADEIEFELPHTFGGDDYRQILEQVTFAIGPAIGWHARVPAAV